MTGTGHAIGIGIEIGTAVVHAVLLDDLGAVAATAEARRPPGPDGLHDALVRIAVALDAPGGVPVRLAWFPLGSSIETVDVTAQHPGEVADTLARWSAGGRDAAAVIERDGRRWLAAIRWPAGVDVTRVEHVAATAGFDDASCEPSPMAVARLAPGWSGTVSHTDADRVTWRADVTGGAVRRAVTAAASPSPPDQATIRFSPPLGPHAARAGTGRDVVALGAAVGAAAPVERAGPIHSLAPVGKDWPRWAVELVADDVVAPRPRPTSRWSRRFSRATIAPPDGRR